MVTLLLPRGKNQTGQSLNKQERRPETVVFFNPSFLNPSVEVVEEMQIVGFVLRSDLKTSSNTKYIIKKTYSRIWIVSRLKALGASRNRLIYVLDKQFFSNLLLAVHAQVYLLTKQERIDLEGVLKTGLRIIWGKEYSTFDQVLKGGK